MNKNIPKKLISQLSELITAQMGLHFPRKRWQDLERGIRSATRELGFEDTESCIKWVLSSSLTKKHIEILASHLTIGETYFFRDKKGFEIFEKHILPEVISTYYGGEQHLRIWSAGCSTGEEPYSIAIMISKVIPDLKDWNITILATDINTGSLQKASEGVYGEWSFRDTPSWVKEKYFKRTEEGCFKILPHIKKMVKFSYFNLVKDVYPSLSTDTNAMDVIFCRNVLMYFSQEQSKEVIRHFYNSLVNGGWQIVSPVEKSHFLFSQFQTVKFHDVIHYKKDTMKQQVVKEAFDNTTVSLQTPTKTPDEQKTDVVSPRLVTHIKGEKTKATDPQRTPYEKALTLYEQGCYEDVIEKLQTGQNALNHSGEAYILLARAFANQGKLTEANECCENAIKADKLNEASYYLHAIILQEQGHIEEALVELKRSLYLRPNFVLAHFALGNLAQQQGKFKESEKHFGNTLVLLRNYRKEDILPESEGITAGRLMEIIASMSKKDL